MKKAITAVVGSLALVWTSLIWLAVAQAVPAAPGGPPGPAPPLHVEGAQLKDSTGKTVILRGVNHPGFVDVPDGAWDPPGKPIFSGMGHWDPPVVKGTLDGYRKSGFNVVRFHTVIDWWKNNPQAYKDPWRSVRYPQPYRQMMKDTEQWDYMCWVNLDYPPPQGTASTLAWVERHPLRGDNLVYGTHLYRNSGGGGPGSVHRTRPSLVNLWEAADVRQGLELAQFPHTLRDLKKPVLVTEIGAFVKTRGDDLTHELLWFKNTLAVLNAWNVGYTDWVWRSDEHLDHGALHHGLPNQAGRVFLDALKSSP